MRETTRTKKTPKTRKTLRKRKIPRKSLRKRKSPRKSPRKSLRTKTTNLNEINFWKRRVDFRRKKKKSNVLTEELKAHLPS